MSGHARLRRHHRQGLRRPVRRRQRGRRRAGPGREALRRRLRRRPTLASSSTSRLVDTVAAVDGVDRVAPFVQTLGFGATNRVIGPDGEALGSTQGPPTLLESWIDDDVLNPYRLAEGRGTDRRRRGRPQRRRGRRRRHLDRRHGHGDHPVRRVGVHRRRHVHLRRGRVVGRCGLGRLHAGRGTTTRRPRRASSRPSLAAGDGSVDDAELAARVGAALPAGSRGHHRRGGGGPDGEQRAPRASASSAILLIVFGAHRRRRRRVHHLQHVLDPRRPTHARAGAAPGHRRQPTSGPGLAWSSRPRVIGLFAAVVGLAGGVGLAQLVTAGFSAAGADLPTTSLVVSTNTVVIAFVVGLGVTLAVERRSPPCRRPGCPRWPRCGRWPSTARVPPGSASSSASLVLAVGAFNLSAAWRSGDSDSVPAVGLGAFAPHRRRDRHRTGAGRTHGPRASAAGSPGSAASPASSPPRTRPAARSARRPRRRRCSSAWRSSASSPSSPSRPGRRCEPRSSEASPATSSCRASQGFGPPERVPAHRRRRRRRGRRRRIRDPDRLHHRAAHLSGRRARPPTSCSRSIRRPRPSAFDPRMHEGEITDLATGGIVVDVGVADDHALAIGDEVGITGPGGAAPTLRIDAISDDFTLLGNFAIDVRHLRRHCVAEQQLIQAIVVLDDGADFDSGRRPDRGGGRRPAGHRRARPRGVHRRPLQPDHQLPHPRLRPAAPVGDHRDDRHRQHAVAVDPRADPRARPAPGRRHVPVAAALGRAVGGGHHLAARHRGRARSSACSSVGRW